MTSPRPFRQFGGVAGQAFLFRHIAEIRSWTGRRAWQGSLATFLSHHYHHVLPKHGGRLVGKVARHPILSPELGVCPWAHDGTQGYHAVAGLDRAESAGPRKRIICTSVKASEAVTQFYLPRRPSQDRGIQAAALSFVPRTTLGSRQHYSANDERGEIASAEERVFSPLFSHFSPTFHPHPIPVERTVRQDPRLDLRRLTEPPCCHVQHGSGAVECVPRSF